MRRCEAAKAEFLKIFKGLCSSRSAWEVWADLMTVMACSLANVCDRTPGRYGRREKEYSACIERLGGLERPVDLFGVLVEAMEAEPDQDFLGDMYMSLELGNHWKGQFFTPYHASRAMAEMLLGNCQKQIEDNGWISICDPTVGGGAMLIAAANTLRRQKIYYHDNVLFMGQDIDRIVAMMAYIQISLLGCAGYIAVANSLTNPVCGFALNPLEKEGQEFWYTPFYFGEVWQGRRLWNAVGQLLSSHPEPEEKVAVEPAIEASKPEERERPEEPVIMLRKRKRDIEGQMDMFSYMRGGE